MRLNLTIFVIFLELLKNYWKFSNFNLPEVRFVFNVWSMFNQTSTWIHETNFKASVSEKKNIIIIIKLLFYNKNKPLWILVNNIKI